MLSSVSSDDLCDGGNSLLLDKLGFTPTFCDTVKTACSDSSHFTPEQLKDLARALCAKSFEKCSYSFPITSIMITILDVDKTGIFNQSLIACCREWFHDRAIKLRPSEGLPAATPRRQHRWPAFISFVCDFYIQLKCNLRGTRVYPTDAIEHAWTSVQPDYTHFAFANLLYDCCMDIVGILETTETPATEIDCLLNMLRCNGKHMESDLPERMPPLIEALKNAFIGPVSTRLPDNVVKTMLELIEFSASGWKFNSHQEAYYYPRSVMHGDYR